MPARVTRLAAYALLRREGKMLLCRLSRRSRSPGVWTLPGGGLEFGESPEEALVREIDEETGLVLASMELIKVFSERELYRGKEFHVLQFIYRAEAEPGPLRVELQGSTDLCEWVAESQIDGLPLVRLVQKARELL